MGTIENTEDGIKLIKHGLDPAKHKLRMMDTWAISAAHLQLAEYHECEYIELNTIHGEKWQAKVSDFSEAIDIYFAEKQWALPKEYWLLVE